MTIPKNENLTVQQARAAIRRASNVYAAVVVLRGGDHHYIKIAKSEALASLAEFAKHDVTECVLRDDNDVYIN